MANISEINGNLINAATASYLLGSVTSASYAATASFLLGSITSASYAATSSYSTTLGASIAQSGPGIRLINSANATISSISLLTSSLAYTASYSTTLGATLATGTNTNQVVLKASDGATLSTISILTASFATSSISASYAATASYSTTLVAGATNQSDGTLRLLNSANTTISSVLLTASIALSASGSLTGSLFGTASWATNALTASLAPNYVLTSATSSMTVGTASLALRASGSLTGSLFGTSSWATNALTASYIVTAQTASYVLNAVSSSFAATASLLLGSVTSASYAATASFVNTLNQSVTIINQLTVGTSSAGGGENTLIVGLPPNVSPGEGGQLLLQASGGIYTSASMIDTYQDRFRILRGTNASSDAEYLNVNLHTGQVAFNKYTGSGAFTGTEVAMLGVDSGGNILTTTIAGSTVFGNYIGTGFTNPVVTYLPFGVTTVSGLEAQRQIASPFAGTLKNFYLRTNATAPATSYTTFTLRVNGVSSNVKLVISGGQAAAKYSNTTDSVAVAIGDEISLQVSTSVANGPQVNQYSFGIYPS